MDLECAWDATGHRKALSLIASTPLHGTGIFREQGSRSALRLAMPHKEGRQVYSMY
jgi:hypothetical protein